MVNNCIFAFPLPPSPPLLFFVFVPVGPVGREITNRSSVKRLIFLGYPCPFAMGFFYSDFESLRYSTTVRPKVRSRRQRRGWRLEERGERGGERRRRMMAPEEELGLGGG